MSKKAMSYYFKDNITIAKNLHLNYTMGDLLEAVLMYEVKRRLRNVYHLNEEAIEKYYEELEDIIFKKVDVFNHDNMDKVIDEYLELKNNEKKGI